MPRIPRRKKLPKSPPSKSPTVVPFSADLEAAADHLDGDDLQVCLFLRRLAAALRGGEESGVPEELQSELIDTLHDALQRVPLSLPS